MERVLVLVAVAVLNPAVPVEANLTTLDDFFTERYQQHIHEFTLNLWSDLIPKLVRVRKSQFEHLHYKATPLLLSKEILEYFITLDESILMEFATALENVTVQLIYEDLNHHCSEYLTRAVTDLRHELRNTTCVMNRFRESLITKMKTAVKVGLRQLSRRCIRKELAFCKSVNPKCTLTYEKRVEQLLSAYIVDLNDVDPVAGTTPLEIIAKFINTTSIRMSKYIIHFDTLLELVAKYSSSVPTIEPFGLQNLIYPWNNKNISAIFSLKKRKTKSQGNFNWAIIRSNTATVDQPCSNYRDSRNSDEFLNYLNGCYNINMHKFNTQLIRCAYKNMTSQPLTWFTAPSVYFHSQCLCLVSHGNKCGVEPPEGVDPFFHCLAELLRDLQRQVSFRPAVTYLDYAYRTRVSVCSFANLLEVAYRTVCNDTEEHSSLQSIFSVQCYFKNLVNKHLNCSETLIMNTDNHTILCRAKFFVQLVSCEGNGDGGVPYYGAGDSTPVLLLTLVDVGVRILTLVTYLCCPRLRNLPGKVLIGYQLTALLRLFVVRASLKDMALAVRLDVAFDLASTLCLTAYLYFLTVSISTLQVPGSLSPYETRLVLLRYSLFGWALPAVLSAAFFFMDDALDSRVHFGQLFFVLCNYVALAANFFMFLKNCYFYYDAKNEVHLLKKAVTERSVLAGLFNFAMKTSLLSGAGIAFRLIFTQIPGLELTLAYYHALGTLQGLLLFVLYGCSRQARAFWFSVFCSILRRCNR